MNYNMNGYPSYETNNWQTYNANNQRNDYHNSNDSYFYPNINNAPYADTPNSSMPYSSSQQSLPDYNAYNMSGNTYGNQNQSFNNVIPNNLKNRNINNKFGPQNTSGNFGSSYQNQNPSKNKPNKRPFDWNSESNYDFLENKCVQPMFQGLINPALNESGSTDDNITFESGKDPGQNTSFINGKPKYTSFRNFRDHFSKRTNNSNFNQQQIQQAPHTPDLFMGRDESYPPELNKLMNPFYCGVCNSRLNSIKSANVHYESRAHDKHLTNWMKKTYADKGLVVPELKRFVTEEAIGPFRCELCKLDLTSPQHALQHNNGRRHKSAAAKICPPTGIGYYDVNGVWVQTGKVMDKVTGKESTYILVNTPTGSEPVVLHTAPTTPTVGIKRTSETQNSNKEPVSVPEKKPNLQEPPPCPLQEKSIEQKEEEYRKMIEEYEKRKQENPVASQLASSDQRQTPQEALSSQKCTLCAIETTSYDQMVLHLKGIRHTKKLRALGEPPLTDLFQSKPTTILESLNDIENPSDVSMYRTPSGSYYCKHCNTALADLARIRNHILSKAHMAALKTGDDKTTTTKMAKSSKTKK